MPSRNQHFGKRPPLADHHHLKLHRADGPFASLNPTRAHFGFSTPTSSTTDDTDQAPKDEISPDNKSQASMHPGIQFLWRSRDNRKGRHRVLIDPSKRHDTKTPRASSHPKSVLSTTLRTLTYFPVWDISWLVAFIFTMGSVVWVINGFFSWLPLVAPSTEFQGEGYYGGGVTAFIGAILFFETGSVLLILEAINVNREGCFGWATEQALEGGTHYAKLVHDKSKCRHHHQTKPNFIGKAEPCTEARQLWQWYPTWHDLREHYIYDLGFLAGASQLFGATVFGTAGFTALPGIMSHLQPQWRLNAAYWIPQVIGGSGFIVSSTLYMLETQQKWWKPAPGVLGWHVSFWNLIGAYGFTLCGALGMAYGNSGAQYQAALATFWGSWAFLIGSYLQLYESINKFPVQQAKNLKGH